MIVFKLLVKVPFNKRDEAIEILNDFLRPMHVHPGLITAGLYIDLADDGLLLLEEWVTRDDLIRHIQSQEFRRVLAVMDMAREYPDIYIHTVSSSQGFEMIENLYELTSEGLYGGIND